MAPCSCPSPQTSGSPHSAHLGLLPTLPTASPRPQHPGPHSQPARARLRPLPGPQPITTPNQAVVWGPSSGPETSFSGADGGGGELAGACSCGIREQGSPVRAEGAPEMPGVGGGLPHGLPAALRPQPRTCGHQARMANPWGPALPSVLLEGQATFNSNPGSATERRAWPWQAISFL